ncbi:unnamed protein product [Arabis nemorensis]|uniref:KIB1-4 beta-propeller domain-containing protein n=1 Tax=Arabis nemorensis TaxID=586526 RepID=A0A565B5U6_9BRAS|nr:unnamed protein product [Arabis nemorensis]
MSQLFGRISRNLCSRRSEFSTATTPYLLLGSDIVGDSPCGGKVVNFNLYDPRKQEQVKSENQIVSKEVHESRKIGSSRGWLASMNKKDSTVHLTNTKTTISLPPLTRDKFEPLVNVSVSSANEDFVIAVKFYGSRLCLCRVGDSEWTRVDVPCPSFHSSTVMFSERDRRFYLNNCNPDYTGPTDFTPGSLTPVCGYKRFFFSNFPSEMPEMRHSRFRIQQQLVESSSSGQSFIVCWFVERCTNKGEVVPWEDKSYNKKDLCKKTHKIMVFRQDQEQGVGPYTDDIGDLCIFLGDNEAFCLSSKDYPGLNPNSVYFAGHGSGFGVCDLASRTIRRYLSDSTPPRGRLFWIPPTPP